MDPRIAARRRSVAEHQARGSLTRVIYVLAFMAVVGLGAWLLFRAPVFAIAEISVGGGLRASIDDDLRSHGIEVGRPMVSADLSAALEAVEADPWVVQATIERNWPDVISVSVVERTPTAEVACADGTVLAAVDGTVLPTDDPGAEEVGRISLPSVACDQLSEDLGARMGLEFLDALPDRISRATEIGTGEEGIVATVATYLVRLGSADGGAEKARALVAVLVDPPEPGSTITLVAPTRPAVMPPQVDATTTPETTES